jgi:hypothetical protein
MIQTIEDYAKLKAQAPQLIKKAKGYYSYAWLAKQLGYEHRAHLWEIEHGVRPISDEMLIRLIRFMEGR